MSAQNDATITLNSFFDSLSLALGMENAVALNDNPQFKLLNKIETVRGFQEHLFGELVDEKSEDDLEKFLGAQGNEFNTEYLNEGSHSIGAFIGYQFYSQMKEIEYLEDLNMSLVLQGFKFGTFNEDDKYYSGSERASIIQRFMKMVEADFISSIERRDRIFWKDVLEKPNLEQVGETGIYFETLEEGTGDFPTVNSDIETHYILTNNVGDTLESSYVRESLKINLSQVIAGWQEAFPSFQKGGKYRLFIPWEKAYKNGNPQSPQGALCFYIEFIDFGPKGAIAKPFPMIKRKEE